MSHHRLFAACLTLLITVACIAPLPAVADETDNIQAQIDTNTKQIAALQAEIAEYQKQLDVLGEKKSTLQSTINTLALSQKQLANQIQITQSKISSANLKIRSLTLSISDKEASIASNKSEITRALQSISQDEQTSVLTTLLSRKTLGDAWRVIDETVQFNASLLAHVNELRTVRAELASNRDEIAAQKASLVSLQTDLTSQKRSIDASKFAQQQLLLDTKNQEANYQKLIAQKQASEQAFEQELVNLQGQLNLIVHPDRLPKVGSGVLSWPFSTAFMLNCGQRKNIFGNLFCITQYFGNTAFSTANPQIYNGKGHNAIDVAAPIGTPVHAALSGVVLDTGNTDLVRGCYSFGKWIMIIHGNGLSTLYAHLSQVDVTKGQQVNTGDTIALSGMTGYATGPHIHFGVYATEGTQIMTLRQFRGATKGCADAKVPVAALTAYLNPLSYL